MEISGIVWNCVEYSVLIEETENLSTLKNNLYLLYWPKTL